MEGSRRLSSSEGAPCSHCGHPLWFEGELEDAGCAWCMLELEENEELAQALEQARAGPGLRLGSREVAAQLRRELLVMVAEAHPPLAMAVLETFDHGAPTDLRGYPEEMLLQREEAWDLCLDAAGASDPSRLDELRAEVRHSLGAWREEVADWFVEQVGAIALAFEEPLASRAPDPARDAAFLQQRRDAAARRNLAAAMRPLRDPWDGPTPIDVTNAVRVAGEELHGRTAAADLINVLREIERHPRLFGEARAAFWTAIDSLLASRPDLGGELVVLPSARR